MGIRPAIASISHIGNVWKVLVIQMAAFYCIFLSSLRDPILNKSLLVSSNEGKAMSEATRIKLSTINKFYQYEVDKKSVILVGSEKLIFSMKELVLV